MTAAAREVGVGTGAREVTLRLMAAPTDVASLGDSAVGAGRVLEWIDKAAYACAVGWCGGYCVTVYVGNVDFKQPIHSGDLVEVRAELVHTGRSSMHIEVSVASAEPRTGAFAFATSCTVVFVAVGPDGRPVPVAQWVPDTEEARAASALAVRKTQVRERIAAAMAEQEYTSASAAPQAVLRFLAAPTDVNWGGKTHGGTVMRWIDEAAFVCATGWSGGPSLAVYSGGIRFYRPIHIGHLVEVEARLLSTGRTSMHVSVHVRSGDPRQQTRELTTHCLTVFVAMDNHRRVVPVRSWRPELPEDVRLEEHARHLIQLRGRLNPRYPR